MASKRNIFDAIIRHRIDVQRYGRGQVAAIAELLGKEDAKIVELLRQRLPNLKAGDIRGARMKLLFKRVKEMRGEALASARLELADRLIAFGNQEGETISKVIGRAVGGRVSFAPVRAAQIREAVTRNPFSGGKNATHTLSQWFDDMKRGDQKRLLGAVQLGVVRNEPIDVTVQRIAGTKAAGYTDGVLSITRRQAETAVRTAVNHTANAAQLAWGQANSDVVIGFEWTSLLDERTCEVCAELNGSFVPIGDNEPPAGMEATDQMPPVHPNDRCTLVPVFDLDRLAKNVEEE